MMIGGVPVKQFGKELFTEIGEDNVFNGAAALGYYLTLAIFPTMIFIMAVIPYLPIAHVDRAIMDMLRQAMPPSAAQMFSGVVRQVTTQQHAGLLSFGAVAAIWAMSAGMYAIMQQLNITYDVDEGRPFIKARLTAIGLSLLFTVLVIAGFSLIVLGGQIQDWLIARFGFGAVLLAFFAALRWVIIVLGLLLGFALVYYLAPNVKQRFKFITYGSVVGAVLLAVASLAFAWYTSSFGNYSVTYGSIGAVIVLILWLYIMGLVILIGSEVNALIEHHSADGKSKGERTPGEGDRNPTVRERVRQADPAAIADGDAGSNSAAVGGRERPSADAPVGVQGRREPQPVSVLKIVLTMLTLAAIMAISRNRHPPAA